MKKYFFIFIVAFFASCSPVEQDVIITIDTETVLNDCYIGNGAQWDPYQLDYGKGKLTISEADWEKLYDRLDFMRPQFIRIMINTSSFVDQGKLVPERGMEVLSKMLDYCQSRNVTVMFGDWGWSVIRAREAEIDSQSLRHAAALVDYLVHNKGYSCIRYYNLVNEPNGYWAATNKSFPLWASSVRQFYQYMKEFDLIGEVGIVGPDIAIWDKAETGWMDSCAVQLNEQMELYDIHTYPSKVTVNSGEYADIIAAYKEKIPEGKKIVMGEIGFKFVEKADSLYQKENIRRARSKVNASLEDSQMFVYDYMYGTDMADALIQTVNTGFSGSIAWMLDDAMHSNEAPDKLKIWGFWNIFGEECFGAEEENVRPWYYAWSLLTRYMPAGAVVYRTDTTGEPFVKAAVSGKDGKYMIVLVNVSDSPKTVKLKSDVLSSLSGCKKFIYSDGTLKQKGDCLLLPNDENLILHLEKGETVTMPAESLIVYTNYDY